MKIEKEGQQLSIEEFERLTKAKWLPKLDFDEPPIQQKLVKEGTKLHKKGEMTLEQLWFGKYYQKEISSSYIPDVTIRWISDPLGWGVFANRPFKKMEFIAEYTGRVRKRSKADYKNAYCFEYVVVQGFNTPFTIDALDQGGLSRYINHSAQPNLNSALATYDQISHVILYAKEPIAKDAQLCYDYGPDYWAKRTAPILL